METRANYLLVGGFVVLLTLGTLGFIVWLAKVQWDIAFDRYEMVFDGSVTGLSVGGAVRYSGVRVGEVVDIRLDPARPSRVLVTVDVEDKAPVKADTVASLEMEGLTGGRYVLLSGGSEGAPPPQAAADEPYPRIATRPSSFEQVVQGAPDMLANMNRVLARAELLLSDENLVAVSQTLANAATLSERLNASAAQVDQLIDNANGTFANLNEASAVVADLARDLRQDAGTLAQRSEGALAALESLGRSGERSLSETSGAVQSLVADSRAAAQSITRMSDEITAMVSENREPLRDFTAGGLYELAGLLNEARMLVSGLNRVTTEVQRDPARFLFGDPQAGYEASGQ